MLNPPDGGPSQKARWRNEVQQGLTRVEREASAKAPSELTAMLCFVWAVRMTLCHAECWGSQPCPERPISRLDQFDLLQEDLDYAEYVKVVQDQLDALLDPSKAAKLQMVSRVLRASLKMDYYESRKVHGSIDELGTRLIFGSCMCRQKRNHQEHSPADLLIHHKGLFVCRRSCEWIRNFIRKESALRKVSPGASCGRSPGHFDDWIPRAGDFAARRPRFARPRCKVDMVSTVMAIYQL